jgi:hypothetical protein
MPTTAGNQTVLVGIHFARPISLTGGQMQTDFCYLIHFATPIAPGRHTAQHYCGSSEDVDARFLEHLTGRGARLCQVAIERNIDFWIVRIWRAEPGQGRQLERRLKNQKMGNRLCPICASERKRQRLQLGFAWAHPLYDRLQFTLADVQPMAF